MTETTTEVTDWWCPTEERWCWCSGPCPDGTPHSETRTKLMPIRQFKSVEEYRQYRKELTQSQQASSIDT